MTMEMEIAMAKENADLRAKIAELEALRANDTETINNMDAAILKLEAQLLLGED
jgi:predicted DNA-binding protein (UPF0251 family)